ncbi:MAG TPA: ABC transporter ATP-binding protein [Methylomirabilota bacterium]|jgi:peptide/nickel transport system ATP-binding protein|nr:ABC transporter ATP-binding protein [Methylomirabilota bacterium]
MAEPLLRVEDLRTYIYLDEGVVRAVNGVSFTLDRGQTMAIVGESGSGKTVVAQSILRILPDRARIEGGRVLFSADGSPPLDLVGLPANGKAMREIRGGSIAMVFQEPMTSFSPVHTIGNQIGEAVRLHRGASRAEARAVAIETLRAVGFPEPERKVDSYPFELSGGLRQRAMIAMALACRPALLIADEPTSALDVTIQAQILDLLLALQKESGMGLLLITHDPGVVAYVADLVTVMYCGKIMETGPVSTLFDNPRHPYLQALLRSTPHFGIPEGERLEAIAGTVPDPLSMIRGCPFLSRCPEGEPELCGRTMPALTPLAPDHHVACYKRGSPPEAEA